MTGRSPRWNIDYLLDNQDQCQKTVPEFTTEVVERLHKVYHLVREHLAQTADYASSWYNRKVCKQSFTVGDRVYVYFPRHMKGKTPKWQSFYKNEAVVLHKVNDATYIVKCDAWKDAKVVHVDKLKPVLTFEPSTLQA